jgi:glycosyltransferase involved in cell wall biosynthesis
VYFETARILKANGHEVGFFSSLAHENIYSSFSKYFVKNKDLSSGQNFLDKIRTAKEFLYNREALSKLEKLMSEFKPDIIHLHIFQSRLSSAIIKTIKKSGIPSVMTVHEYKMLCPVYVCLNSRAEICEKCASGNYLPGIYNKCTQNSYSESAINALESGIRDRLFNYQKNINAFIYPSRFIMDKHIQYKKELKEKSFVIHNFIDLKKFTASIEKENYYLYYGRLSREKGINTLIRAWKNFPELKLKVVGNGPEENHLRELIKDLQITNVELVGAKFDDDLVQIIQMAKFTIVPSEWHETFGLTIIESYACGTPVIAAAIGGITELVKKNETGFLFESRNENNLSEIIKKVTLLSSSEYAQLSKNCIQLACSSFSEELHYKQLMEVYKKLS